MERIDRYAELAVRVGINLLPGQDVLIQADAGADLVRTQLQRDPQASFLGEVAIVDGSSRVAQLGLTFHNTLYDENMGCHIAYGMAYDATIPGGPSMTDEEKLAAGLNVSSVHTDVVIGGPEVDVDALDADGNVTPILRDNTWQLPLRTIDLARVATFDVGGETQYVTDAAVRRHVRAGLSRHLGLDIPAMSDGAAGPG